MSLPPKRLAIEAVPVALILLFWTAVSWLFTLDPRIGEAVRTAGVVMAALYVVVRGVALAPAVSVLDVGNLEALVRENGRVALAAGYWFAGAAAVHLLEGFWNAADAPGLFTSPAGWMIRILAGAGLGVVGVYAVAAGYAALGDGRASVAPADD